MAYRIVLLLALMFVLMVWAFPAKAAPVAQATGPSGAVVVLTDEPCRLTDVVDMPNRATWTEKGKTFEGCAAPYGPLVVLYFREDRSIAIIPVQVFRPLRSL